MSFRTAYNDFKRNGHTHNRGLIRDRTPEIYFVPEYQPIDENNWIVNENGIASVFDCEEFVQLSEI